MLQRSTIMNNQLSDVTPMFDSSQDSSAKTNEEEEKLV